MNDGCPHGVASARRQSGRRNAINGWNNVSDRMCRVKSSVRWLCHGGVDGGMVFGQEERGEIRRGREREISENGVLYSSGIWSSQ